MTLALLRTQDRASYRRLWFAVVPEALSGRALPALGTLVYRVHRIAEARWHQLLGYLARCGIAWEPGRGVVPYAMVDSTGGRLRDAV